MNINKKKIVKYAGIAALVAGITIGAYEASVDHKVEYCHLCDIFGLKHQAYVINNGRNKFSRFHAFYEPGEEIKRNYSSIADYTDDHVINYVYEIVGIAHTKDEPEIYYETSLPLEKGKGYSLNEWGILTNDQYRGERVDLYDLRYFDEDPILIRTFKK